MPPGAATIPDLFTTAGMTTLVLLVARVGGLVLIAPVFSHRGVPMKLRTTMILLFSVLMVPVARAHGATTPMLTPLTMMSETLIGFGLGLGSAVVLAAASAAGDLMAIQMGLSGAAVMDPMTNVQVPVLGQFMTAIVTLLLLSSGGHLVMLDGLGASLEVMPIGTVPDLSAGMLAMAKLGGHLLSLGVLFAAPVMAATMITNAALAILTKVAPQLQIITVAFPLQIAAGLFTLAAGCSLTAVWFGSWSGHHDALLGRILGPMLAGVR